jgi:hypothetical protein
MSSYDHFKQSSFEFYKDSSELSLGLLHIKYFFGEQLFLIKKHYCSNFLLLLSLFFSHSQGKQWLNPNLISNFLQFAYT